MPCDLLEAELFGIEKGVATGVDRRTGIVDQADGGTILLDEVGDMALETQAKLLRVLEGKLIYRVDGRSDITVDVRFIAATNRPLDELVESGAFRRTLFHRLAAFVVSLPLLRARREDIPLLASHFFQRECAHARRKSPGVTRAAPLRRLPALTPPARGAPPLTRATADRWLSGSGTGYLAPLRSTGLERPQGVQFKPMLLSNLEPVATAISKRGERCPAHQP